MRRNMFRKTDYDYWLEWHLSLILDRDRLDKAKEEDE